MIQKDSTPVSVLIVDDSAVVREALSVILSQEPGLTVTTAPDPLIAMAKMAHRRPDVILLDLEMPRMSGIAFLRKIMRESPIPVVVCSAYVGAGAALGIEAMEAGAVDVVPKPQFGVREFLYESAITLIDSVRAAAGAKPKVVRRTSLWPMRPAPGGDLVLPARAESTHAKLGENIIAIGASTGGTEALRILLEAMPVDAPGMVIVQHMPQGFTKAFAARLDATCAIKVKEAVQGDSVIKGHALIAPGNRHMLIRRGATYYTEILDGPLVSRHRPSVDVLFRSVARVAGPNAVGIIMTGMGADGANGLLEMKNAGAFTIAQDEESCVVFGMPKEAIDRGAVCVTTGLQQISATILHKLGAGGPAVRRA
jgi:two-component system, chemotaxis family, protein-glutamate methylesterase/glutaminase